MTPRINLAIPNEGIEAMRVADRWAAGHLNSKLLALVKVRASQLNGCNFCLHMHSGEAFKHGESPTRLLLLDAWRESALFSDRERVALAWTESLTRIAETHAPDEVFEELQRRFSHDEIIALSVAIALINGFNRLAIGARAEHPGERQAS
ncbi:carboxymuconolactone decarboxylase family protein [Bradyrhizobium sp. CCBAU 45384]|uniref:carboxymuconolactone decarboxylase family protein n=1 Tax=Bradyrhizobium sp. CCBAU 45384 TaxID=858428 RepID=UPI002304F29D|nr:carboxymuconolactone decarboxylase family protein [Bradyrhizobium sp. CCBAU 45384]MDA9408075.1 alkylhydroperoxidase [Bradyrhizobium sp. CCBAU 45384]